MRRIVALLPDSVTELCLVRVGFQPQGVRARIFAARLKRAIDRAAAEAIAAGAGLLQSERFAMRGGHFGVLQYWRSFDEMEAWSRRPPHAEWWRGALERSRTKRDFGISHETFLCPRDQVESLYLNCTPTGLAAFGTPADPVGRLTTSRDRLRRRREPDA